MTINAKTSVETTTRENNSPQPQFNVQEFNDAIWDKGYDVFVEKGMRCPCINEGDNVHSSSCLNCGGSGWFYIDRKETRMLVQSITRITKHQQWSAKDIGTASLTVMAKDKLSYMDRVILRELESWYSQVLYFHENDDADDLFAFTLHNPIEVLHMYLFKGAGQKHQILEQGTDYTIEGSKITLNYATFSVLEKPTVSIRYSHNPEFYIMDTNRDLLKQKTKSCPSSQLPENYPLNYVAKRGEFVPDIQNYAGDLLFDNSNYG